MTIFESHRVFIGACGWLHPNWHEQFYPEDLPEDWQLAYYGNEFPVVQVREQEWQQAGDVSDWLEDTEDSPLFVCELPLQNSNGDLLIAAEPYLQKINQLGKRCIGIVCHLADTVSAENLSALLDRCNELAPTCVDINGDIPESLQAVLKTHSVNIVCRDVSEIKDVTGPLVLLNIHSDKLDLKELRQLMDHMLQYEDKEHTLVLIMCGEPPGLEMMKQAKVLLELL